MARACVFCGAEANSKEHAFPAWLNKIGTPRTKVTNTRETGAVAWDAGGFDHTVRQICASCNMGWLSQLESTSKDLVTALVLNDRACALSPTEQIKLSTWLYKTGIMLALVYPETDHYVARADYRYFFEKQKPPDGTTIFIAGLDNTGDDRDQLGWARPQRLDFSRSDATVAHGYQISFSVLALLCQIYRGPVGGRFVRPRRYADAWTRVRPVSKGAWPLSRVFLASGLEDVARGPILTGPE
jgi:hypothetical protein